ncbi:MAG: YhdP family protein [Gammaproteobacteria bacterium]
MKHWLNLTWKWLVGVVAAVVILCATLMGLFRMFVPLVPGYREQAQTWADEALGRPVSITSMGATWGLFGPELTLGKVELLTQDRQRVLITVREIRLGFTLRAMVHGQFSRPSRIILIQPQLTLERETDGSFNVHGLEGSLDLSRERTDWQQSVADTFAQDVELLVRRGEVTVIDRTAPTVPLVFSDIRLNLDNSADSHRIFGRMLLPPALGLSLSFSGRIQGKGANPDAWQWQGDVQASALNLPRLLSYSSPYNRHFSSGLVDLRGAVSGTGMRMDQLQATFNAQHVTAMGGASGPAGFSLLAGSVNWTRSADGWILSGSDVHVQRDQDIWPASRFDLHYSRGQDGLVSWSGSTSFLRLQDIVTLSAWLPESFTAGTTPLLRLSPSGDVTDAGFQAQWNGKSFNNWSLHGHFSALGLHADGEIPGFSGLNGTLSANQDAGTLQLTGSNASVTFPHLFRGPLAFTTLKANVRFNRDAQGWHFSTTDFSAANPDIQRATAKGSLLLPADGSSPVIDLQASAQNVNAGSKSAYLPVGIMPKEVVDWLDSSVAGGEVPSASLVLRGKLHDFPYDNGQGLFDIRFHLVRGILDYASGWPRVQNLEADVEFKNQGMSVAVQHASLLGDDIGGATARFTDLRQGILEIKGTARGGAQAALTFLRSGPLKQRFGQYLDNLKVSGHSDVSLHLTLPVEHVEQFKLDGRAQLREVSVGMESLLAWQVSNLNGNVDFGTDGVSADKLNGMWLGEPVTINLRPDGKQDATLVTAEGGANAAMLSAALPVPFNKTVTGSTNWRLTARLPNNPAATGLSLDLMSDLQGLGVILPAPFGKPDDASIPFDANLKLTGDKQLLLQVRYANTMDGLYRFVDASGGWRFDRGDLVFGGGKPSLPDTAGLTLTGTLPEFSLDAWKAYSTRSGSSGLGILPPFLHGVDVEVGQFSGFGQKIDALRVQLAREPDAWQLGLGSKHVSGRISLPYKTDAAHPIIADMQRVELAHKNAKPESSTPVELNPHRVPPLRVAIGQLRYNGMTLDNLKVEFEPQPDGVSLKSFSITNNAFDVSGSGQWITQADGGQQSTLAARMKSRNIGKTLQAFGFAPGITGDSGEAQAQLTWQGGPLADILPTLSGKLHIKLEDGQLLEVKPGAGRIFGLLSINALPRRLLLNFSDVLGKGLGYDSIEGNFTLKDGDAYTTDLTVAGPAAKIHMVGRTGLAKHDFDEAVLVVPSVGSTLPVLGALAAGVGVGAVVFLLTEIFKKPISEAGEMRYHLTGTWDNPVLTKVVPPKPTSNNRH